METGADVEAVADEVLGAVKVNVTGEAPIPYCGTPITGWPSIDALTTTAPGVSLVT